MKGLDTNVLVRYLTADDARQTPLAEQVLEQAVQTGQPLFVPMVVLCELTWVLSKSYGQSRAQITAVLQRILETEVFVVEDAATVRRALEAYRRGRADFADHLIGEICRQAECDTCTTFDRALKSVPGFTVL